MGERWLAVAVFAAACGGDERGQGHGTSTGFEPPPGTSSGGEVEDPPLPPMQRVMLPAELSATAAAAGDLDGDGNVDLVLSDDAGAGAVLRLWAGDGTGEGFSLALDQAVSNEYAALYVGDYDGDGNADALGRTTTGARMYLHPWQDGMVGDGDYDAVDGTPVGPAHDVDGNGLLDHAYVGDGEIRVRLAAGDGTFVSGPGLDLAGCDEVLALAFGGLDGNDADAVTSVRCGEEGRLLVHHQSGGGSFSLVQELPLPAPWVSLALADLDDDGELDAAGSTYAATPDEFPSHLVTRLGTGEGTFAEDGRQLEVDHFEIELRTGDVDGDGRPELLTSSIGTDLASPYGETRFALVRLRGGFVGTPLPEESSVILVADFDADGCGDVYGRAEGQPVLLVSDCDAPALDTGSSG